MDWRPRSPDSRTSRNQLRTWTHIHPGKGHCTTAWAPCISRVWELPRSHGPETGVPPIPQFPEGREQCQGPQYSQAS